MTSPVKLILIPDTNLFLECRSLSTIPWEELGVPEIDLIVTRPVQSELDAHKKNKSGRTFRKALKTAKLLRNFLVGGDDRLVIRAGAPTVTLSLMPASKARPALAPALDPHFPDDAIILRMMEYREDNPEADVRLLTHDMGPMATARSLKLPFIVIPDSWLLSEQDDPVTAENKKHKAEIERLRRQEPIPVIRAFDADDGEITRIDFEQDHYGPLTTEEVDRLMVELEANLPISNDFGSPETVIKPSSWELGFYKTVGPFVPADADEIAKYRGTEYPAWLGECRAFLEKLHKTLNWAVPRPYVCFEATNEGTRPAMGCLVRISTKGSILLFTPKKDDGERDDFGFDLDISLPKKPKAPRGHWSIRNRSIYMEDMYRDPLAVMRDIDFPRAEPQREPDVFYWKKNLYTPGVEASFECESWRHGVEAEEFAFRLIVDDDDGDIAGAIQCEIHAENLSDPKVMMVPVRITRRSRSTYAKAMELVDPTSDLTRRLAGKGLKLSGGSNDT